VFEYRGVRKIGAQGGNVSGRVERNANARGGRWAKKTCAKLGFSRPNHLNRYAR
jgi:hypothetical protein